ncbi:hypothetical protein N0V86_004642 [Didymella sp. IMI 355093]|nr:hypothetical protein N0V86_004642 [Didymella sp. IMI 355093]
MAFACIENCAKEAIWKWKVATDEAEKEEQSKKQRIDDEAKKKDLVEELMHRDHSIAALRRLLAEKKAKLSGEEVAPATPSKPTEYAKMRLDVLKRLDKARDATIAAILKQMDKVDEDLKLLDGLADDGLDDLEEVDSARDAGVNGSDGKTTTTALNTEKGTDGAD